MTTPTTLSRLPDGRWLVTRQGVASHHGTLAAACIEAGWEGDLPAQPASKPKPPVAHLLHRPASATHPWVVDLPWLGSRSEHTDLSGALGALITATEESHRPHVGPGALTAIASATGYLIGPRPSITALRALAAIARPNPFDYANHLPHGRPADLSHPTEPQE